MRTVHLVVVLVGFIELGAGVDARAQRLSDCERGCGAALASCLQEQAFETWNKRNAYRTCRRLVLGACRVNGADACPRLAPTTTSTLPDVSSKFVEGNWVFDGDLAEVYGCTRSSISASYDIEITQSGTDLQGTASGYGSRKSGYRGQVTTAGFDLGSRFTSRVAGLRCRSEAQLDAMGFDGEISTTIRVKTTCSGGRYCAGTLVGTLERSGD